MALQHLLDAPLQVKLKQSANVLLDRLYIYHRVLLA